jgi:hypothetical protein
MELTFSHRFCRSLTRLFLDSSNSACWISIALRNRSASLAELANVSPSWDPAEAMVRARCVWKQERQTNRYDRGPAGMRFE